MKKMFITLLCALCLSAYAERKATTYTIEVEGIAVSNYPLASLSLPTNYVDLVSMYVLSTNGSVATIGMSTAVSGFSDELFDVPYVAGNATNIVKTLKEYSPRRSVFSSSNPDTDKYRLLGTNTVLTITQTVATTNSYDITLLYEKD